MPKLYNELASWWPLLSAPAEYAEEAEFFREIFLEACDPPPRTLVEFGSGGGNTVSSQSAFPHLTFPQNLCSLWL